MQTSVTTVWRQGERGRWAAACYKLKRESRCRLLSGHRLSSRPVTPLNMTAAVLFWACPQDWKWLASRNRMWLTAPYGHRRRYHWRKNAASVRTPQQPRATPQHSHPFITQLQSQISSKPPPRLAGVSLYSMPLSFLGDWRKTWLSTPPSLCEFSHSPWGPAP